jgi:hypothetical protein
VNVESSLIAALVGALVGGAASLAGSILVGRQDLTRKMRIQMYQDMLPSLQEKVSEIIKDSSRQQSLRLITSLDEVRDEVYKAITVLRRAAIIAGRRDSSRIKRIEELCRRQKDLSEGHAQILEERPAFKVDIALMKLKREYEEAGLSDDERTRRLAEAKKDIEQELRIEEKEAKRKQTADEYFALDQAILEQLKNMHRFLERKIR